MARLETTVTAVAVVHLEALHAQIRTLRLRRAVLGTVAKRQSDTEEMTLLNQSARLSADERRRIVEEFVDEVSEGLDAGPDIEARPLCGAPPPTFPTTPRPSRWTAGGNSPNWSATLTSAATCAPSWRATRRSTRRQARPCGSHARSSASWARRGSAAWHPTRPRPSP
ncbi:hypothetical protein ACIF70_31595 [Actinacidiphila glaucinigra]|uniref:hypothetical protein n=1 Tax=Actinacidiphila glaucinigra TaxID=235986 RepID=UPI0037C8BAF4